MCLYSQPTSTHTILVGIMFQAGVGVGEPQLPMGYMYITMGQTG